MSALPIDDQTHPVALTVNGRAIMARAEPRMHVADFLRERLNLTGTHLGCEHGVCGACTILIDGEPARACLTFAVACDNSRVETIEGLDQDEIMIALRGAFTREHALQCGFCTPGMLITARDLVLRLPDADERRVRLGLAGNLCRCTGYTGIVRAVRSVISERRARGIVPNPRAQRPLGPVGASTTSRDISRAAQRTGRDAVVVPVALAAITDFTPAHMFNQGFTIAYPPDQVFALFGRIEDVASCLPGASITARPSDDTVGGAITIRLGPIAAAFRGTVRIERDEASRSGRIIGVGAEGGGRSTTQGMIRYRLTDGPALGTTHVDLQIGYTLKGALAQFSRPGLVRSVADRIITLFAANLEAQLAGRSVVTSAPSLKPLSLMIAHLRRQVVAWLGRGP
jgi:carbon-monoxide dehydrogenase small subunit